MGRSGRRRALGAAALFERGSPLPGAVVVATALALAATTGLAGCGTDRNKPRGLAGAASARLVRAGGCDGGEVSGGGSTFVQTLVQQWIAAFEASCPRSTIDYQGVGSGAGIQQLTAGTVDFAGSDVPVTPSERAKLFSRGGPVVQIPWAAGGIAVEYHLDRLPALNLSAETLASIFSGRTTRWDDPAIRADNPHASLPSTSIQVFHRSDGSGTTAALTSYLSSSAPRVWRVGSGKQVEWPAGVGVKGSDQITAAVAQSEGSIGYSELSYARAAGLDVARIENPSGRFIAPSTSTVAAALASAPIPADLVVAPDARPPAPDAYPISIFTFAVVFGHAARTPAATLLKSFLEFALGPGQASAVPLAYAPLPPRLLALARAAVEAIGT